jgi:hypothetical protein
MCTATFTRPQHVGRHMRGRESDFSSSPFSLSPPSSDPPLSFPRSLMLTGSRSGSSDTGDRPYPCDQCDEKFSRSFVQPSMPVSCRSRFNVYLLTSLLCPLSLLPLAHQGSSRSTQRKDPSLGRESTPAGQREARREGKRPAVGRDRCWREARCKGETGDRGEGEKGKDVLRVPVEGARV